MSSVEVSPLMPVHWSEISPSYHKVIIRRKGFYLFYKFYLFFEPLRRVFWIFLCEVVFFKIILKWPFIPYMTISIYEILNIGFSTYEPYKLYYYNSEKCFFCRHQWESITKIIACLHPKVTLYPSSCSIILHHSIIKDGL